jgi:TolB-like protein
VKRKLVFLKIFMAFFGTLFVLISCMSVSETSGVFSQHSAEQKSNEATSQSTAQNPGKQPYTGDGGKGTTIVVPTPQMYNPTMNDSWMPQLFQDLITGDLARFSSMTVLDRLNEELVLAEQNLSLSGNYSDNDYIRLGNLTNAQFIVAGNIQNISGRYNVSFRINNTETRACSH